MPILYCVQVQVCESGMLGMYKVALESPIFALPGELSETFIVSKAWPLRLFDVETLKLWEVLPAGIVTLPAVPSLVS
jgi:hypothetical protein